MGGIGVASVVASIISAFGSGMEVFHRLGGKKRKSSARPPHPWEEAEWAEESLENRPLQIRRAYDQNVVKFGRRFEVGDSIAQSTLAQTLLALNTDLINLINHALSADPSAKAVSHRALFTLSETAALDTMAALGQLKSRLSLASSRPRLSLDPQSTEKNSHQRGTKDSSSPPLRTPKRPSPAPLLVRGGWVRSKSGTSIVSATAANKAAEAKGGRSETLNGARTEKHIRCKSASAAVSSSTSHHESNTRQRSDAEKREVLECTLKQREWPLEERTGARNGTPNEHSPIQRQRPEENPRPQRQPSMLIVPADFFDSPSPLRRAACPSPPPRPPKLPLDSKLRHRPRPAHDNNVRPTSAMTFMTASTKIGEIPASRGPDDVLPAKDVASRIPAYVIPPPLEASQQKKRKGLRFWKRDCET